jgi:hypothetical protein
MVIGQKFLSPPEEKNLADPVIRVGGLRAVRCN